MPTLASPPPPTTPPMPSPRAARGSLREKVAFRFLLVAILPMVAMGFLVLVLVRQGVLEGAQNLSVQLLKQKASEADRFIAEVRESLDITVGDVATPSGKRPLDSFLSIAEDQSALFLESVLAGNPSVQDVMLFDLPTRHRGKVIAYRSRLREVPDAEIVDRSDPASREFRLSVAELSYFADIAAGKTFVSPVRRTLDGPSLTIAVPVRNSLGEPIAGVVADVNLKRLQRLVEAGTLGSAGYLVLVDQEGNAIAAALHELQNDPSLANIPLVQAALHASPGMVIDPETYASVWGEWVIGASTRLSETPFVLVSEWPTRDALALERDVRAQVLLFTGFMALAALLASWLIARGITQPVRVLQSTAQRIGGGDFVVAQRVDTGDELEELDTSLHEMAKSLKLLEQLREEFVFIAAHELRTPVTAIKGYVSMLLEDGAQALAPQARTMLEHVGKANEHLVQLVQDLLEVARNDAGRMRVDVSPQPIDTIVGLVVEDLRPLWEERGLAVVHGVQGHALPSALVDPEKFREVAVNLVSNAIKYNREKGSVTIHYDTSPTEVTLHVSDAGIGMTPDELAKLFGKFYRAENDDTRRVPGTGLGLFIVKQIVEKMGGRIDVTSERGVGSTFSVTLRRAEASDSAPASAEA